MMSRLTSDVETRSVLRTVVLNHTHICIIIFKSRTVSMGYFWQNRVWAFNFVRKSRTLPTFRVINRLWSRITLFWTILLLLRQYIVGDNEENRSKIDYFVISYRFPTLYIFRLIPFRVRTYFITDGNLHMGRYTVSFHSDTVRVRAEFIYSYIVFFRLTSFRINTSEKFILSSNVSKLYVVVSVRFPGSVPMFVEFCARHAYGDILTFRDIFFFLLISSRNVFPYKLNTRPYINVYISKNVTFIRSAR